VGPVTEEGLRRTAKPFLLYFSALFDFALFRRPEGVEFCRNEGPGGWKKG